MEYSITTFGHIITTFGHIIAPLGYLMSPIVKSLDEAFRYFASQKI